MPAARFPVTASNPNHDPAKIAAHAAKFRAERDGAKAAEKVAKPADVAEKPLWVEGQRFTAAGGSALVWYVERDAVYCNTTGCPPEQRRRSSDFPTVAAFEAAIRSGELVPADTPAPQSPASPVPPVDHSKIVTPAGREVTLWNYTSHPESHACWAVYVGHLALICRDGAVIKNWNMVLAENLLVSGGRFAPNQWPIPAGTGERLDAYYDKLGMPAPGVAVAEPAETPRVPYDAETWPKGHVLVKADTDMSPDAYGPPLLVCKQGVYVLGTSGMPEIAEYGSLMDYGELSLDGGKTWQPASRVSAPADKEGVQHAE